MNDKKLAQFLNKWYWKHHQILTVDTFEDRTYSPETYHCADVCLFDPSKKESVKFLFTISNYHGFDDLDRNLKGDLIEWWDSVRVSSTPYYIDRNFFIKKWKPLTDNDIYNCAKYFIDKVLGLKYRIWNIRVNEQTPIGISGVSGVYRVDDPRQLEFDFTY